jgi:hypothetical protein
MTPRIVSTGRGARWLIEGWRLFRAAPFGWLAMVATYWLIMTFISVIPIAGVVAAALVVPAFSVGFMAAARAADHGGRLEMQLLFEGFRNGARSQLVLGVVYFVSLCLVLGATSLADGGMLARWMLSGKRPAAEAVGSEEFVAALFTAALLYTPVMMMFWFAPPLASWHGTPAAKALFFSFFACLLNWRAFLAYGAMTAVVTMVVPFVLLSAVLIASGGALKLSVMALVFPLLLVLLPTLFASFYASYRQVFGQDDGGSDDAARKTGSQDGPADKLG